MEQHMNPIEEAEELKRICADLKKETMLAVDTEFIRETTYSPKLALIQIATESQSWLIDNCALSVQDMQPLLQIFQDRNILKIFHYSQADQECLYHHYQITASPSFDTFEAASLLGYGESPSLQKLTKEVLGIALPKHHTRSNWLHRPLADDLKKYALADVENLVKIAKHLLDQLEKKQRQDWAIALSQQWEDPSRYQTSTKLILNRLLKAGKISQRSYPIVKALVKWREGRARELDKLRKSVMDDDTIISIANARPQNLEQLKTFRGIHSNEIKKHGEEILQLISNPPPSEDLTNDPKRFRAQNPTHNQANIIALLSTYLRHLCSELGIATRLTLTNQSIEKIVLENLLNPRQWFEQGLCSQEAASLVSKEILAMLNGRRALTIQGGKMVTITMKGD